MSTLVLELKQGELMIINGAPIRFKTRSRIELAGQARFLFGKQILTPDEANTPARRIYFALQAVYVGTDQERDAALISAASLIAAFKAATTSALAREILDRALTLAQEGACYEALKLARRIIRHETAVFENAAMVAADHSQTDLSGKISEIDEVSTP
jgi:flagellar biosynthesis repressor protein FlbT